MPSLPFLWWAIGLALAGGFGLGAYLFFAVALRLPIGAAYLPAVQAHGHVQVYGWGGMFALGVGLFFLPRLRGCPPPSPRLVRLAAWLLGIGLLLRGICQPLANPADRSGPGVALLVGFALSGVLELAGALLAVAALVRAASHGPPLRARAGLPAVLPFAACFFVSLVLGLLLNAFGTAAVAMASVLSPGQGPSVMPAALVPPRLDVGSVHLGLNGALVAISAAVSARTFPLYLRTRVPAERDVHIVAATFVAGLLIRSAAPWIEGRAAAPLDALGSLLEGFALLVLVFLLDVPLRRTRRDLGGREAPPRSGDLAAERLIQSAYAWLAVAAVLLAWAGVAGLASWAGGWPFPSPPVDAERHALGAGLVTLLILGMAVRLVPGFVGRPLNSDRLAWATVWLGNGAALLRVAPLFLPASPLSVGLMGVAGVLGVAAVACLGVNLWRTARA